MEDARIVDMYWARSEKAIAETSEKYGNYCYSIAYHILADPEDAEECVNDTWLGAWNSMPPHRPALLSTFLGKITRRISIDKWRRRTAEKRGGGEMALALDELSECVPSGHDVEREAESAELADATLVSIREGDARKIERLGDYLPDTLSAGCRYGPAGYYETTMKDGTRYRMIRVTYENGQSGIPAPVPENAQSATEMTGGTAFLWMIWGHCPDTDRPILKPDQVSARLLKQMEGGVFYIDYGGVYVGISQLEIGEEELMTVIDSVGKR